MIVKIGDEIDGVTIDTSAGGRLASWVMAGRERLLEEPAAGMEPSLGWGCYLMAPFVGRVRRGSVDWAGRKVRLRLNGGRHSLQGAVFDSEWTVVSRTAASVSLSCPLDPNKWPFRGTVTQRIAIARGLMRLEAEIVADEPMPAALGWHPWFRNPGGHLCVGVRSDAVLALTPDLIPTGELIPVDRRTDLRAGPNLAGHHLDDVYAAVRSPVVITWPDIELTMSFARPIGGRGRAHAPTGRFRRVGYRLAGLDSTRQGRPGGHRPGHAPAPARSWRRRRAARGRSGPASSRPAGSSREAEPFGPFARSVPKPAWRRGVAVRPTISQPVRSRPGASRPLPARPMTAASPALLGLAEADGAVRCVACAHRCLVRPGRAGICRVRENRDGRLVTTVFGQAVAANADPIEKKPLFHVYPGSVCLLDRDARLQLPLPALPELDDLAGRPGRPERGRVQPASRRGRGRGPGRRFAQRRLHLHRADGLHRVRRRDCPTGHGRRAWPTSWSRTAIRLRRPWTCWPRSSRPPTSISSRSTIASTGASSARVWRPSWTLLRGCAGAASGSR